MKIKLNHIIVLFFTSTSFLMSFNLIDYNEKELKGVWISENYDMKTEVVTYKKVSSFKKNKPGIKFLKDGKIIKRQNSGSCGTEPIDYDNFKGTWKKKSNSTIEIRYKFWAGNQLENWEIIEITDKKLKFKRFQRIR